MAFRKMPKDRSGKPLRPGDVVRVVGVPALKGMSEQGIAESMSVFRYLRGKSVPVESITEFGMAWLNFVIPAGRYKGWHGVAIESRLLERLPNTSFERTQGRLSAKPIRRRARRSTQPLAVMHSFDRIWPISDIPSDDISIYDGPEVFIADFANASPAHQVVFAACWFQAEVLNGGLKQFFSNDTGVLAPEAVQACRTLGLPQLAQKCEEAMAWFGYPYPRERALRQAALETYTKLNPEVYSPFDELDEVVGGLIYDEAPGLKRAAINFVKAHAS